MNKKSNGDNFTNGNKSNGSNNNSNNNTDLSPEAKARYEKNKEFREKNQKYISLETLYKNARIFQFDPNKIEETEEPYQRIQYTVTEPNSKYPDMEKFLSFGTGQANMKASEQIDAKIFEEGKKLLKIWKKGQGNKTQYFVQAA